MTLFFDPGLLESDLALIQGARTADREATERLLRRMDCVRRFITSRNRRLSRPLGASDLEDVIQDTLIAIWSKLDQFQGYGRFEVWCFRFCILELRGKLRDLGRDRSVDVEVPDQAEEMREPLDEDELGNVYQALDELGPPASDVIRLKLLEGLTFDRIAEELDASPGTVRAWYYRGLRKLRDKLQAMTAKRVGLS